VADLLMRNVYPVSLESLYGPDEDVEYNSNVIFLYDLLQERDLALSISHRRMPTFAEHRDFVMMRPYKDWQIIYKISATKNVRVGACYLTHQNEIGIFIAKAYQRRGHGLWAVSRMMDRHPEAERFMANINPNNEASFALFRNLGFGDLQVTLQREMMK
jgi:RimJ/RimL family protein N-acetyltransferase